MASRTGGVHVTTTVLTSSGLWLMACSMAGMTSRNAYNTLQGPDDTTAQRQLW